MIVLICVTGSTSSDTPAKFILLSVVLNFRLDANVDKDLDVNIFELPILQPKIKILIWYLII
jgi:hypothetical protein